jgi:hypothetical protein
MVIIVAKQELIKSKSFLAKVEQVLLKEANNAP